MAWLALAASASATQAPGGGTVAPPLVVSSTEQLIDALQPANAGRRIQVEHGNYGIDRPLHVPDRATLEGAGVMKFDADGVPGGFEPGTESTLRVTAGFAGNVLRVRMEGVSGSGVRRNVYGHVAGPTRTGNQGTGNRLEIDGDPSSFESSNPDLDPPPAAGFFRP